MNMRDYAIFFDSSGVIKRLEELPDHIQRRAVMAVNKTADRARTLSARRVRQEVNFPTNYVSPSEGRLSVKKRAGRDLEARVTARMRATSLARFAVKRRPSTPDEDGVRVIVKPGVAQYLKGAKLVRLNVGKDTDTAANLGLAVWTRNGRAPSAAYMPKRMKNGGWLLYGPSVAQALLSLKGKGIWPDLHSEIREMFETELLRLLDLKNAI